jgi:hypothetical protein
MIMGKTGKSFAAGTIGRSCSGSARRPEMLSPAGQNRDQGAFHHKAASYSGLSRKSSILSGLVFPSLRAAGAR